MRAGSPGSGSHFLHSRETATSTSTGTLFRISSPARIIAALVLWFLTMGSGAQVSRSLQPAGDDSSVAVDRRVAIAHWMRIVYVVLLLVVMIWKPGA